MYITFIRPTMEYASEVWDNLRYRQIAKLKKKNSKLTNKYFFKYQVLKSENLGVTLSVHKEKYFLKSFLKYCP